jgi:hypothetical protein
VRVAHCSLLEPASVTSMQRLRSRDVSTGGNRCLHAIETALPLKREGASLKYKCGCDWPQGRAIHSVSHGMRGY